MNTPGVQNVVTLSDKDREVLDAVFRGWGRDDFRLPGRVSYQDVINVMYKLGVEQNSIIALEERLGELRGIPVERLEESVKIVEENTAKNRSGILHLICSDGWTYVGWQRVIVLDSGSGESRAREVAEKMNSTNGTCSDAGMNLWVGRIPGDPAESLFVLSGESYTMQDFAEGVVAVMGGAVTISDGPGEEDDEDEVE